MKAFLGSMTGRVFMVLLLGVVASAALTQWLAVGERQRAIEQYRDFHAVERAEQLVMATDMVPLASRAAYLKVANKGSVRLELRPDTPHTPGKATEFSSALQAKLGDAFRVTALAERPEACVKPREGGLFAPKPWGGYCENLDVHMQDGHVLRLLILPPRQQPPFTEHNDWMTLLPFLISIAILAYLVTRMTMRPLKQLAQAAKDLGNDINHPPLTLSGASEIRQAGAAFNAMQARIRQHIFQRTQMLAAITHDLQTPLTRLRLRLEKVADSDLYDRLVGDLSAMQSMVKEGLDLARSMDSTEAMQALDLDSLLDSVCSDAADAGQNVTLSGQAGMALMGRPIAMRRCLVNLIDNAVKYGQYAHVTVERITGAARIRIRDGGPGIAPDQLAKVFEPFYRIETSRSRESGGTGLGLTIARNIAEQHGATVLLSNHVDGGLEVTLIVPQYYAGK
ncbi:ATP-binding protein [Janthinobacterium aquaticum]|uniref:ATP-binding protein n=1 Tax=Janthinobacterium sp. FT58W TaxID=2654254 RepID=UPI00126455E5|nr:ATP-binding protein [Janthinobacterium sp. FT58W]KAB8041961.1 HAMP domain-containing protein [Janthinobacterium sp. FT58W]